jgi:hypothetical protein
MVLEAAAADSSEASALNEHLAMSEEALGE